MGADVGIMGGSGAHEFMVLNEFGEDTLVLCDACGYAANQQIAVVGKPEVPAGGAPADGGGRDPGRDDHRRPSPASSSVGPERTAKAAFFMTGDGRFIVAIVRGDYDVNETKLVNAVKASRGLRPATVEEIKARGMEPGYGSPIGARDAIVVVDELVARSPNLVAGANREGFHLRNVNVGRDFTPDLVAEIANAREGDPCPQCGKPVKLRKGIEVGNIFKLGTDFTVPMGATYLGEDGQAHPIVMGSYGIGLGRNVACIVEAHHDDKGIVWPAEVAPYPAHLVTVGANKDPQVVEIAERLHDAAGRRPAPRDPLRRPRRVAGRQVHRRRAPRHAPDPDREPALAGRRRRRGDRSGDRRTDQVRSIEEVEASLVGSRRPIPGADSARRRPFGAPAPRRASRSMTSCSAHQRIVSVRVSSIGRNVMPSSSSSVTCRRPGRCQEVVERTRRDEVDQVASGEVVEPGDRAHHRWRHVEPADMPTGERVYPPARSRYVTTLPVTR